MAVEVTVKEEVSRFGVRIDKRTTSGFLQECTVPYYGYMLASLLNGWGWPRQEHPSGRQARREEV
jgi:hypothetical protein